MRGGLLFLQLEPEIVVPVDQGKFGPALFAQQILHFGVGQQEKEPLHRLAMVGQSAGGELVLDRAVAQVRGQFAVLGDQFFPQLAEVVLDPVGIGIGLPVMDGDFVEPAVEEAALDGAGRGAGKKPRLGGDSDHMKCGLLAGQGNVNVQGMSGCPRDQFFRRISPFQSEGRFQQRLCARRSAEDGAGSEAGEKTRERATHGRSIGFSAPRRKRRAHGSMLVEITMALALLTVLGLGLLQLSINITAPRQWTLQQSVTDAYMTYERALAERVPFEEITSDGSLWPVFPTSAQSAIELGRLPGGRALQGAVIRTRIPDPNNYPADGGSGTLATNPSAMKVWRLQSLVRYQVGGRTYVKSRTVVRSQ